MDMFHWGFSNEALIEMKKALAKIQLEMTALEHQQIDLSTRKEQLQRGKEVFEWILQVHPTSTESAKPDPDWPKLLAGKTHGECFDEIARKNGGDVSILQATDILYPAYVKAKSRDYAYGILQHVAAKKVKDGFYVKIRPGVYRRKDDQEVKQSAADHPSREGRKDD